MNFRKQKGVTLIALVVTVIVLLILAGVSITTLFDQNDKDLISKTYSTKELAETSQELEQDKLDDLYGYGIYPPDDEVLAPDTEVTEPEEDPLPDVTEPEEPSTDVTEPEEEIITNAIPTGGVYYVGVTTTKTGDYTGASAIYEAGDAFPTVSNGDVYVYGDYEYKYNYYNWQNTWTSSTINGWGVDVLDTSKTTYGTILPSINGKYITDLRTTFLNCSKMTYPPNIPSTVTCILGTYWCCHGLTDLSDFVIPYGVTNMKHAFSTCSNLTVAPKIPNSMVSMYGAFRDCPSLTTVGTIPSSVSVLYAAFANCESLTGNIIINADTIDHTAYIGACFSGTVQPIVISGTCTVLDSIAETSSSGNVTVSSN